MNRKGLLFVINTLEPGGAEMFMVRLAVHLQEQFDIHILSLFPEHDDPEFIAMMNDRFRFKLIKVEPDPLDHWQERVYWKINALGYRIGVKGLYSKLVRRRKDVYLRNELQKRNIVAINSSSNSSDSFAVHRLRKLSGIPVLITMHSSYNPEVWPLQEDERRKFFMEAERIFSNADHILYTADRNIEIFQEFSDYKGPEPKKQYMGYQVPQSYSNIREELGIVGPSFLISMVARGTREKGWIEAIAAFRKLRTIHPNAWLVLVCPLTEHIEGLKANVSEDEHIVFTGYLSNPADVMWSSDCTILPSHFPESLPYSIIESLGAGRPVIATPVAEIPQMLQSEEGMAGMLIPFTDTGIADPQALFEGLKLWVSNPKELERAQLNARSAFQKFTMEQCGGRYLDVFNMLMNGQA
jgi:glycosyltransferase involved in cell wall biosynthesis